jgi:hypothetical protein
MPDPVLTMGQFGRFAPQDFVLKVALAHFFGPIVAASRTRIWTQH